MAAATAFFFESDAKSGLRNLLPQLEIVAVPRSYGRTGRRSFYMDETGAVYAADKKGAEASSADKSLVMNP